MKITIDTKGLAAQQAALRGLAEKKIAAAAVSALNVAARVASEQTKKRMESVFDRPTAWVLGGVRYTKARKDKLESTIDFDKWGNKTGVTVEKVLKAEIHGGNRANKRHENALQRAGILPQGMSIVTGSAADLDRYGNMRGSQIVQIISYFKASGERGYKTNMNDKGRARLARDKKNGQKGFAYFVIQRRYGKLLPGIYKRYTFGAGSSVSPVMIFVRNPAYKKRLDFYETAEKHAREEFNSAFKKYLDQMLKERGLQ